MSAEVLSISGRVEIDNSSVIQALEEILADAKAGKISCFAMGAVSPTGWISTCLSFSGRPDCHTLTAAALYALRRAEKNSGLE